MSDSSLSQNNELIVELANSHHGRHVLYSVVPLSSKAGGMCPTECWPCVTKADVSINRQLHRYLCSCPSSPACSLVRAAEFTWSSLHSVKSCLLAFVLWLPCQAAESHGPLSPWLPSKLAFSVLLSSPPPHFTLSPRTQIPLPSPLYSTSSSNVSSGSIFSAPRPQWECQFSSHHCWIGDMPSYLSLLGNGWRE